MKNISLGDIKGEKIKSTPSHRSINMDMKISNSKTKEVLAAVNITDSVIDDGALIQFEENEILIRKTDGHLYVYGAVKGQLIRVKND